MFDPLIPLRTTKHCGDRLNVSLDDLTSTQQEMLHGAMIKLVGGDSKRITLSPTLGVLSCKLYGENPVDATVELFSEIDRVLRENIPSRSVTAVLGSPQTSNSLQQGTGRKKRGGARTK